MQTKRSGFTLTEIMIVIAIIGLILATLTPRVRTIREGSNLRAAKDAVATALGTARAAAIQKGNTATFHVGTDTSVMVDAVSNGATIPIMPKRTLGQMYGVTITVRTPVDTVVPFNSRGFGKTVSGGTVRYVLTLGTRMDSVCVTMLGLVKKTGC